MVTPTRYPFSGFIAGDYNAVNNWYGNGAFTLNLTLGYLIGNVELESPYSVVMVAIVPWSFFPLDDNIKFQFFSFFGVLLMMAIFSYQFVTSPMKGEIPTFGKSYSQLVGVFITSWAFIMVVPAWVNEKKDHVSINKTIWYSCVFGMVVCRIWFENLFVFVKETTSVSD